MHSTVSPRSRRRSAVIAAAALLLASCGDGSSAGEAATDTAAVAADDDRVLALDEFAGLAALSLGVEPVQVDLTFQYATAAAIFEAESVTSAPASPDGVDLEAVLAIDADTVLGVSIPTTASVETDLDAIAPTTVIDYAASWQDQLRQAGEALDRVDMADALIADTEATIAALRDDLADAGLAGSTVSVLGSNGGSLFALSRTGNVGSILDQLGLGRPGPQDVETAPTDPFVIVSPEQLGDHDADLVVVLAGAAYPVDEVTGSPVWPTLTAAANDAVAETSAEVWFSTSAFAVSWIVDDLRAALLDEGEVASDTDAVERWTAFMSDAG
jgi:iron complex transport system substrate-binding protein